MLDQGLAFYHWHGGGDDHFAVALRRYSSIFELGEQIT